MLVELRKENYYYIFSFILILFLPFSIVLSSVAMNIIVVLLTISFLSIIISHRINFFKKDIFFKFLVTYFIFTLLILYFSNDWVNSFSRTIGFVRFICLAYGLAYFISYKEFKYLKLISTFWLLFFLFISLDLIFEFFLGFNIVGISNQFPGRLSSFLGDELKIGNYYLGFALLAVTTIYYFKSKRLFVFSIIIFLVISLLIGERANFLKLFFATSFFIFFSSAISKKLKVIITFLLIFVPIILINLNKDIQNRFGNQFFGALTKNGISHFYFNSQYGAHFGTGIKMIMNHPLTGIGFKNFHNECEKKKYEDKKFLLSDSDLRCSTHPHQIHLDIASSIGIIGYLILISSFIYLIFSGFKKYIRSKNLFLLSSISFLIFTLFLPLPSGSFFTSYGATIFWTNIGIILAFKNFNFEKN